jgi:hypothetical protein
MDQMMWTKTYFPYIVYPNVRLWSSIKAEMRQWCVQNIGRPYLDTNRIPPNPKEWFTFGSDYDGGIKMERCYFAFADPEHAMLFKLTWCGQKGE